MTNRKRDLSRYQNIYAFDQWDSTIAKDHTKRLFQSDLVIESYNGKFLVIKDNYNDLDKGDYEMITKDHHPELFL